VSKKNTVLEINGQRYDAISGVLLAVGPVPHTPERNIDGILKPIDAPQFLAAAEKLAPEQHTTKQIVTKPTMSDVVRAGVNHAPARRTKTSQTLMRHAVKKPGDSFKRYTKVQAANTKLSKQSPKHLVQIKVAAKATHPARLERAKQSARSAAVTRFTKPALVGISAAPTTLAIPEFLQPPTAAVRPPGLVKKSVTTADILEQALHIANSHNQPAHHKPRRFNKHATLIVSAFVFAFVVTGALASQNMDSIKVSLASTKAGFSASMPNYQPSGYHMQAVKADAGVVAVQYLSNSDARSYSVTQKQTSWDSETLRQEFVEKQADDFDTLDAGGLTVYVYGNGQATWVDNGVWYQVQTDGSLSNRQLIDLARST
jgi:hypothetical protein